MDLPRVLALSACDPEALAEMRHRLADRLENTPDADCDDVVLTLHTGRERFPCRDAVTGTGGEELARLLRQSDASGLCAVRTPGDGPVVVLDASPSAYGAVDLPEVADALHLAEDVCRDGADAAAARAVALQYGLVAWLRARRVEPRAVHGEGLGALAAAAASGGLPLPDALRAAAEGTTRTNTGVPGAPGATVVRIGAPGPQAPDELVLDPADGASYAHVLAGLWRRGYDVDTTLGRPGRRVRLPGHPFRRREPGGPTPAGAEAIRPLTPYEQRWLFYDLVRHGSSSNHNVAVAAVAPGRPPAPEALDDAFAELQRRHPVLRTVFSEPGGRWRARTLSGPEARLTHVGTAPDGGPQRLRETVLDAARRSLELRDAPLVRCCVGAGSAHWALALAVYEPLTATADPDRLLAELMQLAGADAYDHTPLTEPEPV